MLRVRENGDALNLADALDRLGEEGGVEGRPMQSVLVEGGARLASSLLVQDLVDRLYLFVAPKVLGAGRLSIDGLGIEEMDQALTFVDHDWEVVGDDVLFTGYRREA